MTGSLGLFARGVALGLGAAVPIGPVNVQIARRVLRGGFWPGFALGCGAVTADVIYAVLSSVGLSGVTRSPLVLWPVRVGGMALLTYLGVLCLRGEREAWRADPIGAGSARAEALATAQAPRESGRSGYVTGLAMTLFNPMTLAFWFVAVPALAGGATAGQDAAHDLPLLCVGVFAGTLSWVITFCAVLALAGRYRRNWWLAAADATGGLAMLVFATAALLSSIRALL